MKQSAKLLLSEFKVLMSSTRLKDKEGVIQYSSYCQQIPPKAQNYCGQILLTSFNHAAGAGLVSVVTLLSYLPAEPKFIAPPKREVVNNKTRWVANANAICRERWRGAELSADIDSSHFKMSVLAEWKMGHGRAACLPLSCLPLI